jgi:ATP synthase F1 delta subunit
MNKDHIIIAKKYSNAAFSFAEKKNIIVDFSNDLQKISQSISAEFAKSLSSPFVSKKSIIDSVNWLCDNANVSEGAKSFVKIISLNKRMHLIKKIYQNFVGKLNDKNGLKKIEVFSSIGLQKEKKSKIEKALCSLFPDNKIETSYHIDEKILRGLVIKQNNLIIDSSLELYLKKLKTHLIN